MGHPRTLLVHAVRHTEFERPLEAVWRVGTRRHLGCVRNTAPVRVGQGEPTEQEAADTKGDLLTIFARMETEEFDTMQVEPQLQRLMRCSSHRRMATQLQQLMVHPQASTPGVPLFARDYGPVPLEQLVEQHRQRVEAPRHRIRYMSVMCGVAGDAVAARAAGVREEDMVLIECCPEHVANLEKAFPCAEVIHGDIRKAETIKQIMQYIGLIDFLHASIACQPS